VPSKPWWRRFGGTGVDKAKNGPVHVCKLERFCDTMDATTREDIEFIVYVKNSRATEGEFPSEIIFDKG